jgi:hypothetical protein
MKRFRFHFAIPRKLSEAEAIKVMPSATGPKTRFTHSHLPDNDYMETRKC